MVVSFEWRSVESGSIDLGLPSPVKRREMMVSNRRDGVVLVSAGLLVFSSSYSSSSNVSHGGRLFPPVRDDVSSVDYKACLMIQTGSW